MSEGCNDEPLFRDLGVSRAVKDMSPAKLSVKDVYESLCRSRDREIEMVWKRAVFLTAFLIACFTAYGGLLVAYIGSDCQKAVPFTVISVASIGIGFVGMLLSIIWIQMAKGSKAWYEHYENVIECFVKNHSTGELEAFAGGDYRKLAEKTQGELANKLEIKKNDKNIFSMSGGRFSVSKIVILLGQLFFCVWMAIVALHCCHLVGHVQKLATQIKRFVCDEHTEPTSNLVENYSDMVLILGSLLAIILAVCIVGHLMNHRVKSGYLDDLEEIRVKGIGKRSVQNRILDWFACHCLLRKHCKSVCFPS